MVLLFVLFLAAAAAGAGPKPAKHYFDICHRQTSQEKYNECVKNSLIKLKPALVKGIPDLRIQPIDPLVIPKLEMGDNNGNFKLHMVLKDLVIRGVSLYEVRSVNLDIIKNRFTQTTFFPKMDFEGDYLINGQILVLPIHGNGRVTFNFTDITIASSSDIEEYKKGNKTYIRAKDYKMSIEPKFATSYFTNLFNGDKQLGEATNRILNENWRDAYYSYRELPESAFGQYFKAVVNQIFSVFPKDELFPL